LTILEKFVESYQSYAGKYRISIKGFTDKVKVSEVSNRRYRDNLELSALRSISAMRILQKKGIPLNRMEIAGAGELLSVSSILPQMKMSTQDEINDYSRTIVLIISPEKESWP
jgi:flagellar motor protein MotB